MARYSNSASTVADPAPLPNDTDVGRTDTIGEQFGGAACDTVTGLPPIVTVPDRASPGFRVTWIVRLPPADTLGGVVIQVSSAFTADRAAYQLSVARIPAPPLVNTGDAVTRAERDARYTVSCLDASIIAPTTMDVVKYSGKVKNVL